MTSQAADDFDATSSGLLSQAVAHLGFTLLRAALRSSSASFSSSSSTPVGVFLSPLSVFYAMTLALNGAGVILV